MELPAERKARLRAAAKSAEAATAKAKKNTQPSSTSSYPSTSAATNATRPVLAGREPGATAEIDTEAQSGTPFPTTATSTAAVPQVTPSDPTCAESQDSSGAPRFKTFSNLTYKGHSFGDYVETIRRYGTTDSYSTEPVSDCNTVHFRALIYLLLGVGRAGASGP